MIRHLNFYCVNTEAGISNFVSYLYSIFSQVPGGLNSREMKVKIAAAKAAWSEAARSNPDALNIDEFLAFTHPESSHSWLAQNAEELFARHDSDGDGRITEQEYLSDPFLERDENENEDKKEEFREGMDDNKGNSKN